MGAISAADGHHHLNKRQAGEGHEQVFMTARPVPARLAKKRIDGFDFDRLHTLQVTGIVNGVQRPALGDPAWREELHTIQHADPASAKLRARWFEFDLGWAYLQLLSLVGLARIGQPV